MLRSPALVVWKQRASSIRRVGGWGTTARIAIGNKRYPRHPTLSASSVSASASAALGCYSQAARGGARTLATTTSRILNDIILHRQRPFWERIGSYLRIIRLPIIAGGIYSIGYRQGVIHSHQHPHQFQEQLLDSILLEATGNKVERQDINVRILTERDVEGAPKKIKTDRYFQVASVAQQIIREASKHVDAELARAKEAAQIRFAAKMNAGTEEEMELLQDELQNVYDKDEDVQFWTDAKLRIDGGELDDAEPWRFVFVGGEETPANAWVTELLPKRIFITDTMLHFALTIDEMAFLLGHEVGHFILGHLTQSNNLELGLKTTEIVLLSLDPTAGLVTFAVVGLLDVLRRSIEMAFSREHEREADELGLKLVAGCKQFDLEAGAKFMYRMNASQGGRGSGIFPDFLSSHPPSLERSRQLYKDSQVLAKLETNSE